MARTKIVKVKISDDSNPNEQQQTVNGQHVARSAQLLSRRSHPAAFDQSCSTNSNKRKRSFEDGYFSDDCNANNNNANPVKRAKYSDDNSNCMNDISNNSNQTIESVIMACTERDALKKENNDLKTKNLFFQRELNGYKKSYRDEMEDRKKLTYDIKTLQTQNEDLKASEASAKIQLKAKENELDELKQNNAKLLEEKDEHQTQIELLEKECNKMKAELKVYEGKSEHMNTMDMKQLNELEATMHKTIQNIHMSKEKLLECVICKDKQRNTVFIPCGHSVLCGECEQRLSSKICPQCQNQYSSALQIAR